jgi:hypothetical protein
MGHYNHFTMVLLDALRRYSTLLDVNRRYSTLPDATRRYPTLLDATRRYSTLLTLMWICQMPSNIEFCSSLQNGLDLPFWHATWCWSPNIIQKVQGQVSGYREVQPNMTFHCSDDNKQQNYC